MKLLPLRAAPHRVRARHPR